MGLALVDAHRSRSGASTTSRSASPTSARSEGYLERQVPRWRAQLESYAEFAGWPGPEIPGVERVARWLEEQPPDELPRRASCTATTTSPT